MRTSSRAAKTVSLSEVTPASRATAVDRIADHLSAGMLSRCHHLETAGARTPMSDAMASFEDQSAITSRKDRISAIAGVLGQIVLKCKDNLALDSKKILGHAVPMAESETEAQHKQAFIARVKAARVAKGLKQWQMAEALGGMAQDKYKQYESRSYLPPHLVERFSLICGVNPGWLVTGRGERALKPIESVPAVQTPIPKPKRQRRSRAA